MNMFDYVDVSHKQVAEEHPDHSKLVEFSQHMQQYRSQRGRKMQERETTLQTFLTLLAEFVRTHVSMRVEEDGARKKDTTTFSSDVDVVLVPVAGGRIDRSQGFVKLARLAEALETAAQLGALFVHKMDQSASLELVSRPPTEAQFDEVRPADVSQPKMTLRASVKGVAFSLDITVLDGAHLGLENARVLNHLISSADTKAAICTRAHVSRRHS